MSDDKPAMTGDRTMKLLNCPFCGGFASTTEGGKRWWVASQMDRAINATLEEDPQSAETLKEILWDNKVGILRVLQFVATCSPLPSEGMRSALVKARETIEQYRDECGPCEHDVNLCVCDLNNQLAQIDAALADDGWRPIETAPKDGTRIWGWFPKSHRTEKAFAMSWQENVYQPGDKGWTLDDGEDANLTYDPPTAWMPLLI